MALNKMYNRHGNLFHRPFKRFKVNDDTQFCQLMVYVHVNAQKHQLVKNFKNYKWTSYHSFISNSPTLLEREYVFGIFGSKEQFFAFHETQAEYYYTINDSMDD